MSSAKGWQLLLQGYPWFSGEGHFPLPAYSELMPPPHLGRAPYGAADPLVDVDGDPFGWPVSEIEEEYELRPGLEHLAARISAALAELCRGGTVHPLSGHRGANLVDNPYWPPELAHAGTLAHERFVLLMPLDLSRTQDDMGRVRWTLFGSSAQGPERAFWKSFFSAPDQELSLHESHSFILQLLSQAYGESVADPTQLENAGFRILPSKEHPANALPAWTKRYLRDERSLDGAVRYLLTFRPFSELPAFVRERYLAGALTLLPCPQSLVFWGMQTYQRLARELPLAMQIPLLPLVARSGGPEALRVPQAGWLHEPHPQLDPATVERELVRNTYARTHRWNRVHRYDDELALNPGVDKLSKVLFDASPAALGLYHKPMARNCQLWTSDFRLLLNGPNATREDLSRAEAAVIEGGLFGYRFLFPAMRVGLHEVYWQRPLVAFTTAGGDTRTLFEAPSGILAAYRTDTREGMQPVELWPRLLRRRAWLSALRGFGSPEDHYKRQTPLNILSILDARERTTRPLSRSLARHLLRLNREESLEDWLDSLPARAKEPAEGKKMRKELSSMIDAEELSLPEPLTYAETATRAFEEAWWKDIAALSQGSYANKDNADCVLDPVTQGMLKHHHRDLEALGDYLIQRHRNAIAAAAMKGAAPGAKRGATDEAVCGELPFQWKTDFDFPLYGGWRMNQENKGCERDILVVIPGKNRNEAVVMADHYDTAYMEDQFDKSRGGSGARLAASGADDNDSATATLLQAAPLFLALSRDGRLERDVWLLHLTGEEFPADCLGARHFTQMLVEGRLRVRRGPGDKEGKESWPDLSSTRVVGLLVMDMIAHNRDGARDVFQISPGRSAESLRLAEHAHTANMIWNERSRGWNESAERRGKGHGRRSADGMTMPDIAEHPRLRGGVRTVDDPQSSLYNTDGQIFSDAGVPVILFMENYDINRSGYHDTHDTLENIDLDYGSAVAAIAIETVARMAAQAGPL
jgi:hypothetical protein